MHQSHDPQRFLIFRSYSIYRFILAASLLLLVWAGVAPQIIGNIEQHEFICTVYVLSGVSLAGLIASLRKPFTPSDTFIVFWLLIDTAIIVSLLNNSGQLNSSLMPLFMVVVVVGAILLEGQLVFLISAFAVIGLYTIVLINPVVSSKALGWFTIAAWGIAFFSLSLGVRTVAQRLKIAQQAEAAQNVLISELQQTNQRIIMRMNTGVMVVDQYFKIKLINPSAKRLLEIEDAEFGDLLTLKPLLESIQNWCDDPKKFSALCDISETSSITVGLVELTEQGEILIFLEDSARLHHRVEQLKLASLGRLTASIAHEIRNPIGAISYARALLAESPGLDDQDKEMVAVIERQEKRVNRIINKTFDLSKNKQVNASQINLDDFLSTLVNEYSELHHLNAGDLSIDLEHAKFIVEFDVDHLRQIMINLFDNALFYGQRPISIHLRHQAGALVIDVIDCGPVIDKNEVHKLFEPFYTTSDSGSGLGLYICKQLCQVNKANLYYSGFEGHSRFSIIISTWSTQKI